MKKAIFLALILLLTQVILSSIKSDIDNNLTSSVASRTLTLNNI